MRGFGKSMLAEWLLDPEIIYLNHGTVGATPRLVLEAQDAIRLEIERQPAQFLLRELSAIRVGAPSPKAPRLRAAAEEVAGFLGVEGKDLVFVDNATTGVNAVLRSTRLKPGEEIAITDHAYGGVRNAVAHTAREAGAVVRTIEIPGPPFDSQRILETFRASFSPKTRLLIVEHVTAESALVLPAAAIAAAARERGILVLMDGAHVPGAIPVAIGAMESDWYVANLHKWAYAPRSCGVLWARPERQTDFHPPVISWGLDQGFTTEFDWVGTRDPSPFLAAPAGIAFWRALGGEVACAYNHALAWETGAKLARRFGADLPAPESMVGTMITFPLPAELGSAPEDAARVRDTLLFTHRIEVQVHAWKERLWARISVQVYNEEQDIDRLADAVLALVTGGNR